MTLGEIIKKYRTTHEMSMDLFSDRSGISKAYISLLEKNKHPKTGKEITPSIQCIKQAAQGMNLDFNELFNMLDGNVALDSSLSPEDSMESPKTKKRASKNLNKILNAIGMSPVELSKDSGVSKSALNHYLKGDLVPSQENAEKMAAVLNVNPLWLMGIQKNMISDQPVVSDGAVQIKVLGRVAAGIPIEAVTEYIDTEEIPAKMAQSGDYFGLQIHGDSMEPRMRDGDVVIVRKQDDAENGDIVIAMVNGSDATCKRLTKYAGGIGLISLNPNYDPMMFTDQEIVDKPVRIIGKVVELRAKF